MATYVIGDIQGCFRTLQTLLSKIKYKPQQDRLWLAGDLVNRGPRSLQVLQWARSQGDRLVMVLGNHDLHLLSRYWEVGKPKVGDTVDAVLQSPQAPDFVQWLRERPLVYREDNHLLIHGGLLPDWDLDLIEDLAGEAEASLQGPQGKELVARLPGKKPLIWSEKLTGMERLAAFVKIVTRIRVCNAQGEVNFRFNESPKNLTGPFRPWFEFAHRRPRDLTVYCGHWSTLGYQKEAGIVALDTGCVWGGELTAYRLEDEKIFQVSLQDET